jgi:NDP-sugar pyrophosphorylase family protein
VILAAGRGTRLAPLTDALPKPAVPLPGGPLVGWPLRLAAKASVRRVVVNSWWRAELMEDAARTACPGGLDLALSREDELMETGGGIALARDRGLLGDTGPVLVINGDGVLDLDLEPLLQRHHRSCDLATLALLPHLDPERYSRVTLRADGRVDAIRPPGSPAPDEMPHLYPGVMLLSREAVNRIATRPAGVALAVWQPALAEGRLGGVMVSGHWREIGTPWNYLDVVGRLLRGRSLIHPTARVDPDAVVGASLVGADVTVGAGAVLAGAVLSHGVRVESDARVAQSILLGPCRVAADTSCAAVFAARRLEV